MTIAEEILSMLDYLGMEEFPQDGYASGQPGCIEYSGKFTNEYDGYAVGLSFKKKNNAKGFSMEAKRHSFGKGKTPRGATHLFSIHETSEDDPEPVNINDEEDDGVAVLEAIHANLVHMCRIKAYKDLINDEMDLQEMPWCKI